MAAFNRDEELVIQNMLPEAFSFLGKREHKTLNGTIVGKPKYYAQSPKFAGGKVFYTKDLKSLAGLCWRANINGLTQIPSDYKKNGAGVENE